MNCITHRILFSFIIAISLGNIGCGGSAGAKVQQKKGPDGKTETTIEAEVKVTWGLRPETPIPNYSVVLQEFPYNRLLLRASVTYPYGIHFDSPENITTVPMALTIGTTIPVTVRIGEWIQSYNVTLANLSTLEKGTYFLDAPGMMEDMVYASRENRGMPIEFQIGSWSKGGVGALLPLNPGSQLPDIAAASPMTITTPADQSHFIEELRIERFSKPLPGQLTPVD